MEKTITLKDGVELTLRPMRPDDVERSLTFFRGLPPDDREYLRQDVTKREVVEARIDDMLKGKVDRIVALHDGRIVADGALELAGHSWKENVAEIRLLISRDFQRRGLGKLMARELYFLAAERKVERVVVRMMRPQKAAQHVFRKLGFREEFVLPDHVKDVEGRWQDLVLMRCDLAELWREMEVLMADGDWLSHR